MRTQALALFILALTLAGCASPPRLEPFRVLDALYTHEGYTWPEMVITDGHANVLADSPLWADRANFPHYVEQLLPRTGAEPNIGVRKDGSIFVTTFDDVQRSKDYGRTWEVVHNYRSPGYPQSMDYWSTGDPMLWVDTDTDRVFANHLGELCTFLAWSDTGEPGSWSENSRGCVTPIMDHQKLITAPYAPSPVPNLGATYPNLVYLCYQKGAELLLRRVVLGTFCVQSFDGGQTFPYEREIFTTQQDPVNPADVVCPFINGHPAAWADGSVVVPLGTNWNAQCMRPVTVIVSTDNGLTWQTREMPSEVGQFETDPDITITPDGTAYIVFRPADQNVYVARSRDKFATWEGPWRVTPPDHTLGVLTVMTSGDNGRIAIAYLGTKTPQDRHADPSFASSHTIWHLYVTSSFNADSENPTFITQQVTPNEDPAQVGCVWLQGGGGGERACRNLLDFNDMVRDLDGRGLVAFTDGCTPRLGCTGDLDAVAGQSRDRQVAVAVLDSGWSLFAEKGVLPSLGLEPPQPIRAESTKPRSTSNETLE